MNHRAQPDFNLSLLSFFFSACLELIVVIPGDYYPHFKNKSIYRGSISRHKLFSEGKPVCFLKAIFLFTVIRA